MGSGRISFFNFSLRRIVSDEYTILDNARISLLYYGLILSFFTLIALIANIYFQHLYFLTITNTVLLASTIVLFKVLTYKPYWRAITHFILIIGSFINLLDVYISLQKVDAITIEIIIMVVLLSYYVLGRKMGLLYSLLNVIPVVIFMVLQYSNSYVIDLKPEKVDQSTVILCIFSSLILIIFIHSLFYTAFLKSIRQLKQTSDEQRALNLKYKLAIEKAEKSSEAKSEFLSIMSHEIRTPLNAVIGMSNLLIMNEPRPDQIESMDILKFSAGNLLAIVNDVLDFNKIESGKLLFENTRFNMVDLMLNICGGHMKAAQEKGLLFDLDVDPAFNRKVLFGDPTRITQVIFNLVTNAIKFTSKGGIWVKAICIEDRHNTVTVNFMVKDTGIGIAKEKVDLIFEPFIQESLSTTRQYGGTGLGLAIVKRLLELQGLKIQVSSQLGQGSEFSFNMEFPVSTEKVGESSIRTNLKQSVQPVQDTENLGSLHLLIAEDNPVNVMLMKKLLSKWSIIPTVAENGERAVELVQYGNFDIILMDLQMPVMNGFDAAIEIRKMADPKKANIPIIALTASALFDIQEKIFQSGMNDYVSKPFKPNELLEKIQNLTVTVQ